MSTWEISFYRGPLRIDATTRDEAIGEAFQAIAEDPSLLVPSIVCPVCNRADTTLVEDKAVCESGDCLYEWFPADLLATRKGV